MSEKRKRKHKREAHLGASTHFHDGRTERKCSLDKYDVASQGGVSNISQIRSDIGSPVMRKSNIGLLKRRELQRRASQSKISRFQTMKALKDEESKNASSTSGYSKRVSPGTKSPNPNMFQRIKTIDPKALLFEGDAS